MKKYILFLVAILFSANAYADVISINTISADSTVGTFNYNFSTQTNVINGNIEGSGSNGSIKNIKADSIGELDFADSANPRVRDSELLGVTYDTTTSQGSFVYTGLTPATASGSLTSNISAGTAYVNGYRVSKSATSETYTANMDTYVDLSQTGNYTLSAVAVGATAPTVAANSARIAKVTTNGTDITTVTDLANRRIPGLIVPSNFRTGLYVSRDSATVISVLPGSCEINNSMINKTTVTQLSLATAGDWAGGSSLRAADTFGFVGSDASGNLKLHTTAPAFSNYGVSVTGGKKRYSTWSSTVYRIIGWFYMDGGQNVEVASNLREFDVPNVVVSNDTGSLVISSVGTYNPISRARFYCSGNPVRLVASISGDVSTGMGVAFNQLDGATEVTGSAKGDYSNGAGLMLSSINALENGPTQATRTYVVQAQSLNAGNYTTRQKTHIVSEE